jgi:3-methyladenine DNA glycosylase/8-oxoguanine DNA glycosylase
VTGASRAARLRQARSSLPDADSVLAWLIDERPDFDPRAWMAQLTTISGIGPWTVQGALIIALGREDIVLPGDLALRKAVQSAYQLDHLPAQQEVLDIAEKWRPYRSLATSYLFSAAFEPAEAPSAAGNHLTEEGAK